jgi:hypothetical protein
MFFMDASTFLSSTGTHTDAIEYGFMFYTTRSVTFYSTDHLKIAPGDRPEDGGSNHL